jgi:energy-converting hydrogenase Eha subunit C
VDLTESHFFDRTKMKDIVITAQRIKKELYILLGCFAAACTLNAISIILYKTPWYELFTQIGYVVIIAVCIYLLVALIRVVVALLVKLVTSGKKR